MAADGSRGVLGLWLLAAAGLCGGVAAGKSPSCHEVRTAFQLRQIGPLKLVPDVPTAESDLQICQHRAPTCCTKKMEESYQAAVRRERTQSIQALNFELKYMIVGHITAFQGGMTRGIKVLQYPSLKSLYLGEVPTQGLELVKFLISDRDRDPQCNLHCSRSQSKPLCASDGRTYESMCDYQRAKCRESSLSVTHRGRCKDAGQSKCRLERAQALEQAKKPQEAVFIPECNEDGSFTQVQCHTYTGYCWCVTPDGKPISGSSVQNKTPVCSGSVTDKPSSQGNSGRKDDGSKPTPTMETQPIFDGEEITAPTLWIKHLVIKDSKLNSSNIRNSEKVHSCDQERQSALEEARQNPREGIVIPECAPGGLYKPVQCHQSTGYCWCVLVDTGRPLPGTSTRYETPVCESDARSKSTEIDDPFKDRELPGCPEGKKVEFITSLLDALTTDMVQAINSAAPTGGGRFSEPDPSHTLEERVVHWYFSQLDNNSSNDINKRELKPFKRYVKKKAKPKKCARRFTDYCDLNKDKSISLQELKGCLGVSKEGGSLSSFPSGKRQGLNPFIGRLV